MSAGVTQTPCAAIVCGPQNPIDSRKPVGVSWYFSARGRHLVSGLGEVDDHRHMLAIGHAPGTAFSVLRVERVHRVRRDRRRDQIVGGELSR